MFVQIVVGCDGVNSPIARWMGFSEPRYVGHMAFRGLAEYADGQPFEPKVNYIYGRGVRAGFVPVSATKVYWFICFNRQDPGNRWHGCSDHHHHTKKKHVGIMLLALGRA
jgi:2-polyprenyl-6-methoxyphenol hydroxylase-like FAD-dependent oxidoreductase